MRIYTYVIVMDGGAAPNRGPPLTTLAICKPRIRKAAEPGDAVLAFNGNGLGHPDGVQWAGIVREKLTFAEYWLDPRFDGKKPGASRTPDNIYAPSGTVFTQVPNSSHRPAAAERDLSGEFVLVLEPVWHFGLETPVLPESFGLRITGGRRGHRVHEISDDAWRDLEHWLSSHGTSGPRAPRNREASRSKRQRTPLANRSTCRR